MTVTWRLRSEPDRGVEAIVQPVCTGQVPADCEASFLANVGFTGAVGEVVQLPGGPGRPVTVLLGVGTGPGLSRAAVRTAAAQLARAVGSYRWLAIWAPAADVRALVEGYLLGGYRFTKHKSTALVQPDQLIDVIAADRPQARAALAVGNLWAARCGWPGTW